MVNVFQAVMEGHPSALLEGREYMVACLGPLSFVAKFPRDVGRRSVQMPEPISAPQGTIISWHEGDLLRIQREGCNPVVIPFARAALEDLVVNGTLVLTGS